MREFIKYALLVISIVSLVIGMVCVFFLSYCELFGYIKGDNLLKSIHFPLDSDGVMIVEYICAAIVIISYFIRKKCFKYGGRY